MGKDIPWELCKKFNFDFTNKYYMHNPESILEDEMQKLHWVCEMQTNHIISHRRQDLVVDDKKKRTCRKRTEKLRIMKLTMISIVSGALGRVTKGLEQGL